VHRLIKIRCAKLRYRIVSAGDLRPGPAHTVKVWPWKCPTSTVHSDDVHISRMARGAKIATVSDPALTLEAMRRFWTTPRHPRLPVPQSGRQPFIVRIASAPDDASGVQWRHSKAARLECGDWKEAHVQLAAARLRQRTLLEQGWNLRLIHPCSAQPCNTQRPLRPHHQGGPAITPAIALKRC